MWSCGVCGVVVWSCFWGFWCQSQDLSFGLLWLPPHNHRVKIKAKAPSSTVLPPPTPSQQRNYYSPKCPFSTLLLLGQGPMALGDLDPATSSMLWSHFDCRTLSISAFNWATCRFFAGERERKPSSEKGEDAKTRERKKKTTTKGVQLHGIDFGPQDHRGAEKCCVRCGACPLSRRCVSNDSSFPPLWAFWGPDSSIGYFG